MKEFYLTLLSDSSLDTFPKNNQSTFKVKLDCPIQIDKQNWEVALAEMITPGEIMNITAENNFFFLRLIGDAYTDIKFNHLEYENCSETERCLDYKVTFPTGNYTSPEHLVMEMKSALNSRTQKILDQNNIQIHLEYKNQLKRIKLKVEYPAGSPYKNQIQLVFPPPLAVILGIEKQFHGEPLGNNAMKFKYGVDLNIFNSRFFVYSDVPGYTNIGHITAPILRVVPFNQTNGEIHFHQEFLNLHYVPVAKSFIDQVYISIKGDTGLDIPFITGKTLVKLHFRQKQQ